MITFEFRDAQRRADKWAGTPDAVHLEGRQVFAKPFFAKIHRLKGQNDQNRPDQLPAENSEPGSTFTPGPIVDEIATRLM